MQCLKNTNLSYILSKKYKKLMKMVQLEKFLDVLLLEEFGQIYFWQNGAASHNVRINFGWMNGNCTLAPLILDKFNFELFWYRFEPY